MIPTDTTLAGATPDAIDPLIAIAAAALVTAVRKYAPAWLVAQFNQSTPTIVVIVAVGLRALYDTLAVGGVSIDTLGRGVAAGAAAIWGHTQVRSLLKAKVEAATADAPTATDPEHPPIV